MAGGFTLWRMSREPLSPAVIRIAAGILTGRDGRTLLVRKRGTVAFMQPGGKIERTESPAEALVRELREELGLIVEAVDAVYVGRFSAPAANEPGCTVEAELFQIWVTQDIKPGAEIEEVAWVDAKSAGALALAPLTRDHLLPLAMKRR